MVYAPEQQHMIRLALRLSQGAPKRVIRALLEAMAVEANFLNPGYGDRDSEGVLQQRPSTGWGPASESARTDIGQFLSRALAANRGFKGTAGQLAQSIQRSAFPDRYDAHRAQVNAILHGFGGGGGRTTALAHMPVQANAYGLRGLTSTPSPGSVLAGLLPALPESPAATLAPRLGSVVPSNDELVERLSALRRRLIPSGLPV